MSFAREVKTETSTKGKAQQTTAKTKMVNLPNPDISLAESFENKEAEDKVQGKVKKAETETCSSSEFGNNFGKGQPLENSTRSYFESRFGYDFNKIRVYSGLKAAETASSLKARAYTFGNNIAFAQNQYSTANDDGKRLLAHELAHVIQQTGGMDKKVKSEAFTASTNSSIEQEAEMAAESIVAGDNLIPVSHFGLHSIACAPDPKANVPLKIRSEGLSQAEMQLLKQARQNLIGPEEKTAIVGILITEDGKQYELKSGGGKGGADFHVHIEGKAVEKMIELGITRATVLVEKEACQICDRSTYPNSEKGPEEPLVSSRTGEEIARQTPKINSELPKGSVLTVVDPEAASVYYGLKDTSIPESPEVTQGSSEPELSAEPSTPKAGAKSSTSPSEQASELKIELSTEELVEKFTEAFKVPAPGMENFVSYPDQASYEAALHTRYPHFKGKAPRGWYDPYSRCIHFPPDSNLYTRIHESLHAYGMKNNVDRYLGTFVNEGLTEMFLRNRLGERGKSHVYDENVRFVTELAAAIGEAPSVPSTYCLSKILLRPMLVIIPGSYLEHAQERFLGNLHTTHPLHPPLAFLLLFQQLALTRNIAAITLGNHVLADRRNGLARNNLAANGRL